MDSTAPCSYSALDPFWDGQRPNTSAACPSGGRCFHMRLSPAVLGPECRSDIDEPLKPLLSRFGVRVP